MATARQIEVYQLHKDACIANGHPQATIRHKRLEGTLTQIGPQGLNTLYTQPDPRVTDNPMDAGVGVWATWEGLHLRGINQDSGDTEASRMWIQRFLVQFPYIDDNYNDIVVQDDDFIFDARGTRYKLENPVPAADNAWWTAIASAIR